MGVDARLNELERKLLGSYQAIYAQQGHPIGTYHYAPPVPFVGNHYGSQELPKVLVYASAENLGYTNKVATEPRTWLDPANQMVRARVLHRVKQETDPSSHWAHIWPIDNGSLLRIARHIMHRLRPMAQFATHSAKEFMEQIAVANPGKYSLCSKSNIDYAGRAEPFTWSTPYVEADLASLNPDLVIIPRTILETLQHSGLSFSSAKRDRVIVPVYQVSARAINVHLKRKLRAHPINRRPEVWANWPLHTKSINTDLYFQWIDEQVDSKANWLIVK